MKTKNRFNLTQVKVLQDGTRDAAILLTLWYVRRLFWPLVILGLLGGMLAEDVGNEEIDFPTQSQYWPACYRHWLVLESQCC